MADNMNEKIKEIAEKHSLDMVVLFGSEASGQTHKHSDLDVAFLAREKIDMLGQARIATDLAKVFKRTDIDAVDLKAASPLLMKQIAVGGKVLFENAGSVFNEFYLYALRAYEDSRILRELRRNFLDYKIKEYSHA